MRQSCDLIQNIVAFDKLAPNGILAVKRRSIAMADKELARCRIRIIGPSHGTDASFMTHVTEFCFELISHSTNAVVRKILILRIRISALDHKSGDATMERTAIILSLFRKFCDLRDVTGRDLIEELDLHRALLRLDHEQALWIGAVFIEDSAGIGNFGRNWC